MNYFIVNLFNHLVFNSATEDDLELTWLRNHKEIPENPDFRRERTGNTFKLIVAEV